MNFFALLSLPCVILYVIFFRKSRFSVLLEIGSAFLVSLPLVLLIFLLRTWGIRVNWASDFQIASTMWLLDFALPLGVGYFAYLLFLKLGFLQPQNSSFIWFLGFFFSFVVVRVLPAGSILGLYEYFYYPILCLELSYLIAVWLFMNTLRKVWKFYFLISSLVFILGISILPILTAYAYYINKGLLAFYVVLLQVLLIVMGLVFSKIGRKIIWE